MRRDLADLDAFLTVAEDLSFTRAATRMGTSQSAISRRIRRLETGLGVRLLARTTRTVAPTVAGERLQRTLRAAFGEIDAELAALAMLRTSPAGTIRITAPVHAAQAILWPALQRLLPDHPDIQVEISIDSSLTDIVGERFDAGVRLAEQVPKDMIAVPIGPDLCMAAVATPAYFADRPRPLAPQDLKHHRCINLRMPTSGGFYVWEFDRDDQELRVRVDGQLAFDDNRMVLDAVRAGFGIAFVPDDRIADDLASGRLVRVLADWCQPFPGYHLYYPSRRQLSSAFALLVETLRYRG